MQGSAPAALLGRPPTLPPARPLAHPPTRWQLFHTCCREGFPAILQTDNGSEFCAEPIRKFCEMFGIEHRRGAVGRPNVQVRGGAGGSPCSMPVCCRTTSRRRSLQLQGLVENMNGKAQSALRAMLMRCSALT